MHNIVNVCKTNMSHNEYIYIYIHRIINQSNRNPEKQKLNFSKYIVCSIYKSKQPTMPKIEIKIFEIILTINYNESYI